MHFELLQSVSLNGSFDRANEDRIGISPQSAWVIDGATDLAEPGLLKDQGGAAWIAFTADAALSSCKEPDAASTCRRLFACLAEKFEADKQRDIQGDWEIPTAAFALAQIVNDKLQVAWAADCYVLHVSGLVYSWCTEPPKTSSESNEARALGVGIGAQRVRSKVTIENRRAKRCSPDYTALSPDTEASTRSTNCTSTSIQDGDNLLIMSDGFANIIDIYGAYDTDSLIEAIRAKGLACLASELRTIEQEDAACVKFPRFKIGDDATALWIRIIG
ncbi:hypothetical protein [Pleomorphomonas sp. JP5]|uniref:hypothetical protein n=1 Tax=Pleomorphomonas sp. JP5 TaxID=2942998 RepID=UPI002043FEE3|nr:hypothetical protein [Pleomorphomonas sp. JP5]MCM5557443.1 hypothetical protein [Pleomorphomonas sp. JP5]